MNASTNPKIKKALFNKKPALIRLAFVFLEGGDMYCVSCGKQLNESDN
jgi:hypothetical protein